MSEENDTGYTSLRISKKLRNALMNIGRKSQSYEDIIWSLMPSKIKDPGLTPGASEVAAPREAAGAVEVTRKIARKAPEKKEGRLVDDLQAIEKIKESWNSGHRNGAEIAREIGYPRATVNENIKKLKAKGDLKD